MNYQRSFWGVLLLASSLFLPAARAENQAPFSIAQYPSKASRQYPANVRSEFMGACQESVMMLGLNTTQAQQFCQCNLQRLQARYTINQFNDLNSQVTQTGEVPQEVLDISTACANQITEASPNNNWTLE